MNHRFQDSDFSPRDNNQGSGDQLRKPTVGERNERRRMLEFNREHCERYYHAAAADRPGIPISVLLIDCLDPFGAMLAQIVGSRTPKFVPGYVDGVLDKCDKDQVIPTMHVAMPTSHLVMLLREDRSKLLPQVMVCPGDKFVVCTIAANGKSISHLPKPDLTPQPPS